MQIILSKDDIEKILQKKFNMVAGDWKEDGTYVFDTVLEKLVNEDFDDTSISKILLTPPTPSLPPRTDKNTFKFPFYTTGTTGLLGKL